MEQVIQYKRAKHHRDTVRMNKIFLSRDPYKIRQLGGESGSSKEWDMKVEEVMYAAMIRKYRENKDLL